MAQVGTELHNQQSEVLTAVLLSNPQSQ